MTYKVDKVRMNETAYHKMTHLSASRLKELRKSPLRYAYSMAKENEDKSVFRIGTATHMLILEPGRVKDDVVVVELKSDKTKGYLTARDDPENKGKLVILTDEWDAANKLAKRAMDRKEIKLLLEGAETEVTLVGKVDDIYRKARIDALKQTPTGHLILDVKTIAELTTVRKLRYDMEEYGYLVQAAWYERMAIAAGIKVKKFIFIFISKKEPIETAIVLIEEDMMQKGRDEVDRLLEKYIRCHERDYWPGAFEDEEEPYIKLDLTEWEKKNA